MTERSTRTPTFDFEAEQAVIGSALVWWDRLEGVAADLGPEHFHDANFGAVWRAIAELVAAGRTVDELSVAALASRNGSELSTQDLAQLSADAGPPNREHVELVLRGSARRSTMKVFAEGAKGLGDGTDPYEVASRSAEALDTVGSGAADSVPQAMTIPELIASAEGAAPWVILGLIRRDWRVLVVGGEGSGKSTLLRQLAVASAQGIHPLTFKPIAPIRTLIVDAENPLAAIAETGAMLDDQVRLVAGDAFDPERCKIWSQPGGLDLRDPHDRAAFVRELRAQRPQLVVIGPIYKLSRPQKGEKYEDSADALLAVLDKLRVRFGFALVLEGHAPKGQGRRREMSPFGSQRWLAWPEIGISMLQGSEDDNEDEDPSEDVVRLGRFRGDRLDNWWPDELHRGQSWPWEGVWHHGGTPDLEDR